MSAEEENIFNALTAPSHHYGAPPPPPAAASAAAAAATAASVNQGESQPPGASGAVASTEGLKEKYGYKVAVVGVGGEVVGCQAGKSAL